MTVLADQIIPLGDYAPGTYRIGFGPGQGGGNPLSVPDATTSCDISIQRCTTATPTIWPQTDITVDTIPQVSIDGGVTWDEAGASRGDVGGIKFVKSDPNLGELAWSRSGGSFPPGHNRLWRCTFIVTDTSGQNRKIRTSVRVEVD